MKKIISICVVLIAIIILSSIRICEVNRNIIKPKTIEYRVGEKVPFEDDYSGDIAECINGYYAEVTNSNILSAKDFYEKYLSDVKLTDEAKNNWYYLVEVIFYNDNYDMGEAAGVNLYNCPLVSEKDMEYLDEDAFLYINSDMPGLAFSLRKNTNKKLILPYTFDGKYYNKTNLEKANYKLMMTMYPKRKILNIK